MHKYNNKLLTTKLFIKKIIFIFILFIIKFYIVLLKHLIMAARTQQQIAEDLKIVAFFLLEIATENNLQKKYSDPIVDFYFNIGRLSQELKSDVNDVIDHNIIQIEQL